MSSQVGVAPVSSAAFWRAFWVTLRPYLCFVSCVSGLVGLALVNGASPGGIALALGAFFLCYGLGQALTDTTQLDTDSISSPYRPMVRGTVSVRAVRAVSVSGLLGCFLVFAWLSPWTIVLSLACLMGLATYTPLKRRWWGGPIWNSWIVALLPVMGALCAGASPDAIAADSRSLWCASSVFFSYAVFVLLGYLKDVAADTVTGYCTLPGRFGRRITVIVSAASASVALLASVLLVASGPGIGADPLAFATGILLWFAAALWLLLAHARLFFIANDNEAHSGIAMAVRGYVALHAAEAALLRPALAMVAALIVLLFELALARRPCREQI